MILDLFWYLHAPWRRSTKPFTKHLSCCEGKSTCILCVFALCSPSAQSLTIAYFPWCWARSDTFTLHEDAPQNCLQNGWAVVEVSPLVFRGFLLMVSHLLLVMSQPGSACPQPRVPGLLFWPLGCPEPAPSQHWPTLPHTDFPKNEIGYMCSLLSYLIL